MTLTSSPIEVTTEDILSRIGNAMFLVGKNDFVVYANNRFAELTGISCEQIIGRPYSFLFGQIAAQSENPSETLENLWGALAQVHDLPIKDIMVSDPTPRHLQLTLFPLPGNNGHTTWGGALQDIPTERERSLQNSKVFLNLIDELRSSLVFIVGCASTLLSDHYAWSKEELGDFLNTINSNARDTIQMLETMRDISKLALNELELRTRPVNLNRLVQHVTRKLADEKGHLDITLEIPENLPMVDLDAIRISRGLQNLLTSVLKLSLDSRIRLSAQLVENRVQIDIIYRGIKLPENLGEVDLDDVLQARSFNPQAIRDLGLKLHIAQGIFRAHDGYIWTEDAPADPITQQTVIHIVLPLTRRPAKVFQPGGVGREVSLSEPASFTRAASRPKARVLIIDHDMRVSQQLKTPLDLEGYHVAHANEGAAALELAAIEVPDIILLSHNLPDADGLTICRKLRELTSVPIIILAGSSDEQTTIQSLNAGADDYITKPLRTKELLARIQANLRRTFLADISDKSNGKTIFKAGNLGIDFAQHKVTRDGKPVDLTPIEYKLLYNLVVNTGRILTHEQLVSKVWGPMFRQETQYLWVNISRLRAKIELDPGNPQFVLTERGVGYSFYNPDNDVCGEVAARSG